MCFQAIDFSCITIASWCIRSDSFTYCCCYYHHHWDRYHHNSQSSSGLERNMEIVIFRKTAFRIYFNLKFMNFPCGWEFTRPSCLRVSIWSIISMFFFRGVYIFYRSFFAPIFIQTFDFRNYIQQTYFIYNWRLKFCKVLDVYSQISCINVNLLKIDDTTCGYIQRHLVQAVSKNSKVNSGSDLLSIKAYRHLLFVYNSKRCCPVYFYKKNFYSTISKEHETYFPCFLYLEPSC